MHTSTSMTPTRAADLYVPIDCSSNSRYELAIMHRRTLRLVWRDEAGGAPHRNRALPLRPADARAPGIPRSPKPWTVNCAAWLTASATCRLSLRSSL